jgi:hypothetical protein
MSVYFPPITTYWALLYFFNSMELISSDLTN